MSHCSFQPSLLVTQADLSLGEHPHVRESGKVDNYCSWIKLQGSARSDHLKSSDVSLDQSGQTAAVSWRLPRESSVIWEGKDPLGDVCFWGEAEKATSSWHFQVCFPNCGKTIVQRTSSWPYSCLPVFWTLSRWRGPTFRPSPLQVNIREGLMR